jgi:hypothetical protein
MRKLLIAIIFLTLPGSAVGQRIWRAYPASACAIETDWPGDYQMDGAGGIRNISSGPSGRSRRIHCPVISDYVLRQEDIVAVEVLVDDRNTESGSRNAVRVFVCSQSLAQSSRQCSQGSNSVNGRTVVNAPSNAINRLRTSAAGFFTELTIEIPKMSGDTPSSAIGVVFVYSTRH